MKLGYAVGGTRGDVQPAAILAAGLAARGHEVTLGVPPNLVDFARALHAQTEPLGIDSSEQIARAQEIRSAAGKGPIQRFKALAAMRDIGWPELAAGAEELFAHTDAILTGLTTEPVAVPFAERDGVPMISIHHAPVRRNSQVAPLPQALPGTSKAWIRTQWAIFDQALSTATRRRETKLREQLGIDRASGTLGERIRHTPGSDIQAYDPIFALGRDSTWDRDSTHRHRPIVGFIELPAASPSERGELDEWIEAGAPPIYLGFGSMPTKDPEDLLNIARELAASGHRVLIAAGWSDLVDHDLPETVRVEAALDHGTVFPRCAVIVHHGGAGTTAAALRAGVPQVICWFGADQPYWGEQVTNLKIGAAFPVKKLSAELMATTLSSVTTDATRNRARQVPQKLVKPSAALESAIAEVERHAPSG